ncbi:MAG: hypothetical protein KJP16_09870 [Gammaproteobacteria bacterium]|nr:hypothetical protein [Gammaproteobacteria bacterium]NNL51113.1 hypothetical protein [Woeseiaceae bacterium]
MVTLRKIESDLFPALYEQFLIGDDPLSNEQDWRNVFDYRFENEEGYCGYAMLDGNEVIGMLGMVFSRRKIDGKVKKFCNLHTWWVREDHRGRSLALLRPVLKLGDYTITHFTPCDIVRAITKRMGFQDLSCQLRILLPAPLARKKPSGALSLEFNTSAIEQRLAGDDKKVFLDHLPYDVGHLHITHRGAECYVLYTHVVRHRLPYCHIHYVSDMDLYLDVDVSIRAELLRRHKASFIALDERRMNGVSLPLSFKFWAPADSLFKSDDVRPEQIDNLYSDVVFLKLTTLPDMSHEVAQIARSWRRPFSAVGKRPGSAV